MTYGTKFVARFLDSLIFQAFFTFPCQFLLVYDIIGARENQATPKAVFGFYAPFNEQTVCKADNKAPMVRGTKSAYIPNLHQKGQYNI